MFSLESPHRGDSNDYTKHTIFNIKKKITLNYFFLGVNEPSVFEPLKFYCICKYQYFHQLNIKHNLSGKPKYHKPFPHCL